MTSSDKLNGAPGEIRTPDPLVRSQVLYPAELRAHASIILEKSFLNRLGSLPRCKKTLY